MIEFCDSSSLFATSNSGDLLQDPKRGMSKKMLAVVLAQVAGVLAQVLASCYVSVFFSKAPTLPAPVSALLLAPGCQVLDSRGCDLERRIAQTRRLAFVFWSWTPLRKSSAPKRHGPEPLCLRASLKISKERGGGWAGRGKKPNQQIPANSPENPFG